MMKGVQKEITGEKSLLCDLRTKELYEVEVLSAFQNRIKKCDKLLLEMEHWTKEPAECNTLKGNV